jgi:hypothetical protein
MYYIIINSVANNCGAILHIALFCMLLWHSNKLRELPFLANNPRHLIQFLALPPFNRHLLIMILPWSKNQ